MRTFVSRPRTVVVCGAPERASLHTGWLLSGCVTWRSCCWRAEFASALLVAGLFCACAAALMKNSISRITPIAASVAVDRDVAKRALRAAMSVIPSVAQPHVFILVMRAVVDLVLPLLPVAVERRVRECGRIGFALILALLVIDHLRTLAAGRKSERQRRCGDEKCNPRHHDLVPPAGFAGSGAAGAGAWLPGCVAPPVALGTLYAVAQPHTSPPLPRCVTRSR